MESQSSQQTDLPLSFPLVCFNFLCKLQVIIAVLSGGWLRKLLGGIARVCWICDIDGGEGSRVR